MQIGALTRVCAAFSRARRLKVERFGLIAAISATCGEAEVTNKDGGGRRVRTGSEQRVLALSVNTPPPVSAELHAARVEGVPAPMGTALIASSLFLCSLANVAAAGALTDAGEV